MPEKTPRKPFHILLNDDEYTMLNQMAVKSGMSAGAILRAAIRARHTMDVLQCATCASGQSCYVPHMHAPRPAQTLPGIPQ